jgi:hypothetical protein
MMSAYLGQEIDVGLDPGLHLPGLGSVAGMMLLWPVDLEPERVSQFPRLTKCTV